MIDDKNPFDFTSYMSQLTAGNKLAQQENFHFCTCSGISYLEGLLQSARTQKAFVCVSDVTDGQTLRVSGSWRQRRVFTVFILRRFSQGNMTDYQEQLSMCRRLYHQILSRLLRDEDSLIQNLDYLDTSDIRCREIGGTFLMGTTGLYFMVSMDEPIDLQFDEEDWDN